MKKASVIVLALLSVGCVVFYFQGRFDVPLAETPTDVRESPSNHTVATERSAPPQSRNPAPPRLESPLQTSSQKNNVALVLDASEAIRRSRSRSERYGQIPHSAVQAHYDRVGQNIVLAKNETELKDALLDAYFYAPLKEDIKTADFPNHHRAPPFVSRYADVLSRVQQRLERTDDSQAAEISLLKSYLEVCALDPEFSSAIRSLCIFHQLEDAKKRGELLDEKQFDPQLLLNAKRLLKN
jgi:hypothetical protein